MQALAVRNLSHTYPARRGQSAGRVALRGISFDVPSGSIFGLLGPNGSGKSTTFQILATLFPPTSGQVEMFGLDLLANPEAVRRRLGVVFQNPSVDIKLTVEENLTHQGHLYGQSGATLQKRIDQSLSQFRLADRRGERVETLSGGLRRRVELAKCLLHGPTLLLLDEPTTGLDPGARRDLWDTLAEMRRETGLTVLVTTHLMDEAEKCDHLTILHEGNVVADGAPDALKSSVGGDVLLLETADAESLKTRLAEKYSEPISILDGRVRMEVTEGAAKLPGLLQAFSKDITAVRLSKPTLEDVFIHKTGYSFHHE